MNNPELPRDGHLEEEHYRIARNLLGQELRAYYDHRIADEDLTPEFDLPQDCQSDQAKAVFGFSLGVGFRKKIFVIRFQKDFRGKPRFELIPELDPTLRILRLTGQLSQIDQGRMQIERILGRTSERQGLMN